jgi:signal transduction histidine kinase/DNA-binding response OmpR family regulator
LRIVVQDSGPGMTNKAAVLAGHHQSEIGMGVGVLGAQRLMDRFEIDTQPGRGTTVTMTKLLPRRPAPLVAADLAKITRALASEVSADPMAEIRQQNQDMIVQFQELQSRQDDLQQLNQELQDTNRGVVALYAELDERADHLRRADQLKSRFLSNMSHEFRTPLNSILSLSRLLLSHADGGLTQEQEKQVHFIRKSAESLTELVNDLLDLAKVEAGKTVVTPKEFTVADLFGALRGMLRPLLVGDAVALVFAEDVTSLPPLFTDEGKVSQILRNFISNALKFTEKGEVKVSATHDTDNDTVTFRVSDTGIGIDQKHIDMIWQEFNQVPHRLQAQVKGTGLGLPISKKFAGLLKGNVAVESTAGRGSVFSLTIPRQLGVSPSDAVNEVKVELEEGLLPVLAVEDNSADAFSVERSLAHTHYQVISARSTTEAKHILEQVLPVAILLDVVLHGEESWSLLLSLKSDPRFRDVPIIVISTSQEEQKARSFGADEYLDKPIDPATLVQRLDTLTGRHSVTKVLLVDDQEVSRYLIRQLLPRGAFDIHEAGTALDGLRQASEASPDVILLDLNMQEVDGFEFLDRFSASGDEIPPTVVITSAILDDEMRSRLKKAVRIISKYDLSTEMLVGTIRDAIGEARAP